MCLLDDIMLRVSPLARVGDFGPEPQCLHRMLVGSGEFSLPGWRECGKRGHGLHRIQVSLYCWTTVGMRCAGGAAEMFWKQPVRYLVILPWQQEVRVFFSNARDPVNDCEGVRFEMELTWLGRENGQSWQQFGSMARKKQSRVKIETARSLPRPLEASTSRAPKHLDIEMGSPDCAVPNHAGPNWWPIWYEEAVRWANMEDEVLPTVRGQSRSNIARFQMGDSTRNMPLTRWTRTTRATHTRTPACVLREANKRGRDEERERERERDGKNGRKRRIERSVLRCLGGGGGGGEPMQSADAAQQSWPNPFALWPMGWLLREGEGKRCVWRCSPDARWRRQRRGGRGWLSMQAGGGDAGGGGGSGGGGGDRNRGRVTASNQQPADYGNSGCLSFLRAHLGCASLYSGPCSVGL
ncbi:hypothetical protein K504DRAFT_445350 [Pleomassaria siparia CBS 279.74]|uniref:Uncharacterized protein n=1 Tax=Pleomassaria siparia CBS 279.74 TaxID=1314801 RepID=A0A6G1KPL6_9PLEO|nr:hypothetical protein K504DRAFT_445350 [Pleomassaria siparia CBS 279.74]